MIWVLVLAVGFVGGRTMLHCLQLDLGFERGGGALMSVARSSSSSSSSSSGFLLQGVEDVEDCVWVDGRRRFRIIHSRDQDGYLEWVQDVQFPEGSRERVDLLELASNVTKHASSWLTRARQATQQDQSKYEKLLSVERMMPTPRDPERFNFWLATLTKRRPRPHGKLDLLQITDTRERINRGLIYLRAEEQGFRLP